MRAQAIDGIAAAQLDATAIGAKFRPAGFAHQENLLAKRQMHGWLGRRRLVCRFLLGVGLRLLG